MNTLSVINLFPSTKESIADFVQKTVNEVKAGNVNALELKAQLKCFGKVMEGIDEATKQDQLTERQKYSEKILVLYGCKIEVAEVGAKYNYEGCGDIEWNSLDLQIKELGARKKERETFLRALSKPMGITDEFTGGETIVITPPTKTSTTSLKFTI